MVFSGPFSPPSNSSSWIDWIEKLSDGHSGTWRTLEVMRWLVRRDYRSKFVRDFSKCLLESRSDFYSPVETLFLFARDRIKFKEDPPDIERVADFERTTQLGYGDCDDKVTWLATALLNQGIGSRFVVQSYTGESWDHVYLEYWDWGSWKWVPLDPTADGHTGILAEVGWRQILPPGAEEMRFPI